MSSIRILFKFITKLQTLFSVSPIYLTRGGMIHVENGSLRYAGLHSSYQTSTATQSEASSYFFDAGISNIYPSDAYPSWYGFTVWILDRKAIIAISSA